MTQNLVRSKFDILFVLDAEHANYNGDPDAAGAPRQDSETGHGLISPGAINRKIRDYVSAKHGNNPPFAIQIHRDNRSIERTILDVGASLGLQPDKVTKDGVEHTTRTNLPSDKTRDLTAGLNARFFDVRGFGGVEAVGKLPATAVTGAIATMFARSVYPVTIQEYSITRQIVASDEEREKKVRTMGRVARVPYAVFTGSLHVNPFHAEANGFTEEDLQLVIEALVSMWDTTDRTAFRGMLNLRGLWVVRHEEKLGSLRFAKIKDALKIHCKDPSSARSWGDYTMSFDPLPDSVKVWDLEALEAEGPGVVLR
jgi:CRISPR-associated protein Csd2